MENQSVSQLTRVSLGAPKSVKLRVCRIVVRMDPTLTPGFNAEKMDPTPSSLGMGGENKEYRMADSDRIRVAFGKIQSNSSGGPSTSPEPLQDVDFAVRQGLAKMERGRREI